MNVNMIKDAELDEIKKELDTLELYGVTVHNFDDSKKVYVEINGLLRPDKSNGNSNLAYGYKVDAPSLIEFLEANNLQQMEIKNKYGEYSLLACHKDYTKAYFTSYAENLVDCLSTLKELPRG